MPKLKDNFFVIDSENFAEAKSELYGYCITDTKLSGDGYEALLKDESFHTKICNGAFVMVQNFKDKIYISQDFIGSWGLFLFRNGDYWAVSNSFLYLVEYLKTRFALTPNINCMADFMIQGYASDSCSPTMVNEIELLPRYVSLIIDKEKRTLDVLKKKIEDETVELNSKEGVEALDAWFYSWTNFIKNLSKTTDKISVDLSGGMDSRLAVLLFLCSGIDMSKVCVNSIKDDLHTHKEDYEIASAIAKRYGFELNKRFPKKEKPFAFGDIIASSFYARLGFNKQMHYKRTYTEETCFRFCGDGGEMIREYEPYTEKEYIEHKLGRARWLRLTEYDFWI